MKPTTVKDANDEMEGWIYEQDQLYVSLRNGPVIYCNNYQNFPMPFGKQKILAWTSIISVIWNGF